LFVYFNSKNCSFYALWFWVFGTVLKYAGFKKKKIFLVFSFGCEIAVLNIFVLVTGFEPIVI